MTDSRDEAFLQAVADEDCTTIVDAVRNEPKTVPELSEECDIPLSTAYRKINRLQEAGLIEQRHRLRRDCKPKNVYEQSFEGAVVTMSEDGDFEVEFLESGMETVTAGGVEERPFSVAGIE